MPAELIDPFDHRGMSSAGNIDLKRRPVVRNADGSISTVRSISINVDGREVLIPTVSDDGRVMSDEEATRQYWQTGKHLGKFDSPDNATAYAKSLHDQQAQEYAPQAGRQDMSHPSSRDQQDLGQKVNSTRSTTTVVADTGHINVPAPPAGGARAPGVSFNALAARTGDATQNPTALAGRVSGASQGQGFAGDQRQPAPIPTQPESAPAAHPMPQAAQMSGKALIDPFDEDGDSVSRFQAASARTPLIEKKGAREFDVQPGEGHFGLVLKQGIVNDPDTKLRMAAEELFPNDPKAIDRFGFVNGRVAYEDDHGQLRYASGGVQHTAGSLLANLLEFALGALGSITSSPVIGGALGVAGARGLKRAAAGYFLDEPQTIAGNLKDIGTEAGIEAATGGLIKGGLSVLNRGRSVNLTPRDLKAAQHRQARIKANSDVDVDLALASGDRRLVQARNFLAQQPNAGADMLEAADSRAREQFEAATNRVLDRIAREAPTDTLGKQGLNAVREAIRSVQKRISDQVEPLYAKAYRAAPEIKDPGVLNFMKLPYFQEAFEAGQRIAILEGRAPAKGMPKGRYSLQSLDYTKRGLDDVLEKLEARGKRHEARALRDRKNAFTSVLDDASNDAYRQARETYQALARTELEPLEKGALGAVARISDAKAATAAAKLFRDQNVTADEIYRVRRAIQQQDPSAWNALVRQHLANEFNAAKHVTQGGNEVNVPGKLYQRIWGDPAARQKLNAALGPDGAEGLRTLMEAAETLAKAPIRGSNTQANQALAKTLEGPAAWWARVLLKPRESFLDARLEDAVENNPVRLVEALTDPNKVKQLKIATRIKDSTKRAAYISGVLATQTQRAVANSSEGSGRQAVAH